MKAKCEMVVVMTQWDPNDSEDSSFRRDLFSMRRAKINDQGQLEG